MGAPSTTRQRLDQQLTDLTTATEKAFDTVGWNRDQDRHDFERFAAITAGTDRALLLQEHKRHLEWKVERLARGLRYWSSPWWRRGWLRLRGRAPKMRVSDFPPSTEWAPAS